MVSFWNTSIISVEDGLFAEQIQGAGFEGNDFETYWKAASEKGRVEVVVRVQGQGAPGRASATLSTLANGPDTTASIENPGAFALRNSRFSYSKDLTINLDPYMVAVLVTTA